MFDCWCKKITCENTSFVVTDIGTGLELQRLDISQNKEGIDTEDRICKRYDFL